MLLFTTINIFGVQRVAKLQNVLTGAKILTLVSFIVLAFTIGNGDLASFFSACGADLTNSIPTQFVVSLFFIYLAYSGWNAATYVAEELKQPSRTLPLALTVGTILVATLYVGLNLVFIYAVPMETLKGETAVGALAASRLFGPQVAGIFAALMALSLMSTVNAMVTIGPARVLCDGEEPGVPGVGREGGSEVAHAGRRHRRAGRLRDADDADAVSAAGDLHRLHTEYFRSDERGGADDLPAAQRMAKAAGGELRVSVDPGPVILVGVWMIIRGVQFKPMISLAAAVTLATGALVYHFRLRARAAPAPTVETY